MPLHHQVYLDLRARLDSGEMKAGDRLAPERELAAHYGCSLITIRRALDELAREERIERARGRGTFVLAPRVDIFGAGTLSFADEMRERGLAPETRLISTEERLAPDVVAAGLGLPLGVVVYTITRLRLADGVPLILEEANLAARNYPGLLEADFEHQSLYGVLADRYGIQVVRTRESLEPVVLKSREARLLETRPGRPALVIDGVAYAAGGRPVEFTRSHMRGDRTRYFVDRVVARHGTARPLGRVRTAVAAVAGSSPDSSETADPARTGFNL